MLSQLLNQRTSRTGRPVRHVRPKHLAGRFVQVRDDITDPTLRTFPFVTVYVEHDGSVRRDTYEVRKELEEKGVILKDKKDQEEEPFDFSDDDEEDSVSEASIHSSDEEEDDEDEDEEEEPSEDEDDNSSDEPSADDEFSDPEYASDDANDPDADDPTLNGFIVNPKPKRKRLHKIVPDEAPPAKRHKDDGGPPGGPPMQDMPPKSNEPL